MPPCWPASSECASPPARSLSVMVAYLGLSYAPLYAFGQWASTLDVGLLGLAPGELEEHARFAPVECCDDVLAGLKKKMSDRAKSLRTLCRSDQRRQEPLSIPWIRCRQFSSVAVNRTFTPRRYLSEYLCIAAIIDKPMGATHANYHNGENHERGNSRIGKPAKFANGELFVVCAL